jgi:hypothetical protein
MVFSEEFLKGGDLHECDTGPAFRYVWDIYDADVVVEKFQILRLPEREEGFSSGWDGPVKIRRVFREAVENDI